MKTLEYLDNEKVLRLIDQTKLPNEIKMIDCYTYEEVASAIVDMIVRGAPVIGVTAAFGVAIGSNKIETQSIDIFFNELNKICDLLKSTRPTAVNLFWAIDRIYNIALSNKQKEIHILKKIIL